MFFSNSKLSQQLINNSPWSGQSFKALIKSISKELIQQPESQEVYGPYWSLLKQILKIHSPDKSAWFQGKSPRKSETLDLTSESLCLSWVHQALLYKDLILESLEDMRIILKNHLHCLEEQNVLLDSVIDPDAQGQLDLFFDIEFQHKSYKQFLSNPQYFTPRYWEERAKRFLSESKQFQAAFCFLKALETTDGLARNQDYWFFAGEAFFEVYEISKALFCFNQAFELKEDAWILEKIAECHESLRQFDQALAHYQQAQDAMPGNPEIEYHISRLQKSNQRTNSPIEKEPNYNEQQPDSFETNELSFYGSSKDA
jgi:tetratricopeptide (TPR) repeat protein